MAKQRIKSYWNPKVISLEAIIQVKPKSASCQIAPWTKQSSPTGQPITTIQNWEIDWFIGKQTKQNLYIVNTLLVVLLNTLRRENVCKQKCTNN